MKPQFFKWILLTLWALAACKPAAPVEPAPPTATLAPLATATATPVWFPPTATLTPAAPVEILPTPPPLPVLGDLYLNEDFSTAEFWPMLRTARGNIAVGGNRFTLATLQPKTYLASIRNQPLLTDFYLQIKVRVNLCSPGDEYGLLLRALTESEFYRLSLACDNQIRLDKINGAQAAAPQPPILSGAYPPGAPVNLQIGVWVQGKTIRVYINEQYQFSVSDSAAIPAGMVGVFVRSGEVETLSVSFSEMQIYTLEGANP